MMRKGMAAAALAFALALPAFACPQAAFAVESGEIAPERFASYQAHKQETATLRDRREEARRMRGEKASDKKRGGQGGRPSRGKRRR